jgi:hypothetical protein
MRYRGGHSSTAGGEIHFAEIHFEEHEEHEEQTLTLNEPKMR